MSADLLDSLVEQLTGLLGSLAAAAEDPWLLERFLQPLDATDPRLTGGLVDGLKALDQGVAAFQAAQAGSPSLQTIPEALQSVRNLVLAVRAISQSSASNYEQLGEDLLNLAALTWLRQTSPLAYQIAVTLGIVEFQSLPQIQIGGEVVRTPRPVERLAFDRIGTLFTNPLGLIKEQLPSPPLATTANAQQTADMLADRVGGLFNALGVAWSYSYPPEHEKFLGNVASLAANTMAIYLPSSIVGDDVNAGVCINLSPADADDLGIVLTPFGALTLQTTVGQWGISTQLAADIQALAFGGGKGFRLLASAGSTEIHALAQMSMSPPPADPGSAPVGSTTPAPSDAEASGPPAAVIGSASGSRLELGAPKLTANLDATTSSIDGGFSADTGASALVIHPSDADSFLASILPSQGARLDFEFGVSWSRSKGFTFQGGTGADVILPVGRTLGSTSGGVTLVSVEVDLQMVDASASLDITAAIAASMGPVQAMIAGMGIGATLSFPDGGGSLVVADLDLGFRPPTGLGLAIDAGVVTGGGFLSFDPATSEYRGAAQLSIEGMGLTALGLVQTKPNVSFLLLIGTTFPTPIELGFGFALGGVGGIVGINRSVALDALETAVWKGTAKNLLFPSAPITNAATILGTLDTLFPAAPGRYLFGPTGQITWGEPAIVTGNIGLVMELPEPIRIALFGNIVAQFPLKNPVVVLQVTFAGGVDFGSERLFFDASLSGSRIERYPISGDMSLRSSLSSPKNLALAVGGFNPHFQPPAGFPTLSRLALDISDGPLHLHLAAYLAITTNTFQIGAAIDLKAHVCDCDLAGHFAFDALFVENPFSFEVDIDASASIGFEGETFAGIHVTGSLAGPAPWHAKGSASISLLFFSVGVDFDHSWGSPPPPTLPSVDPWTTALAPALADPTSWKWVLPPGVQPAVMLAPAAGGGPTLLDPAGEIILDQKAVPLNQSIDCFADTALATPLRFDLASLAVNGAALDAADWITVTDEFAPAQFTTMTDDEKLSAESFVTLVSGMAIGGTAASVGTSVSASLTYDQIILDSTRQVVTRVSYLLPLAQQITSAASGPSARAPWRTSGLARFAAAPGIAPKAALAPAAFAIVSTATLGVAQAAVASTRYTAALALKNYVTQHSVAPQSVEAVQVRAA